MVSKRHRDFLSAIIENTCTVLTRHYTTDAQ
jgi:hypothetical protein